MGAAATRTSTWPGPGLGTGLSTRWSEPAARSSSAVMRAGMDTPELDMSVPAGSRRYLAGRFKAAVSMETNDV